MILNTMESGRIDKEYAILENIYHQPDNMRQRDLAHIAGISLGMTNAILKRLIAKGLVIARKVNHRNIHYAVTPSGINEIMQRSYRYFKRTIKNIVHYKEKIRDMIHHIAARGFKKIVILGTSDLDFIIEHCARQEGLTLKNSEKIDLHSFDETTCVILSEKTEEGTKKKSDIEFPLLDYIR